VKAADTPPQWVLVAAEPITDIDTTAGRMLSDLDQELNEAGIHLAFAELQSGVRDVIVKYGLLETIDRRHFYRSVTEGVEAYRRGTDTDERSDGADVRSDGVSDAGTPAPAPDRSA